MISNILVQYIPNHSKRKKKCYPFIQVVGVYVGTSLITNFAIKFKRSRVFVTFEQIKYGICAKKIL